MGGSANTGVSRSGFDTVWDLYSRRFQDGGDLLFFGADAATRWSRSVVVGKAEAIAGQMEERGVGVGDRVAVIGRNSVELVASLGAIARVGAMSVPLNPGLTAGELAFQLKDTEPAVVIGDLVLSEALDVALADADWGHSRFVFRGEKAGWNSLDTSATHQCGSPAILNPMEPAMIMYTSGTSAKPKGVLFSHRSLVEEAHRIADAWSLRSDDTIFGHYPMCHVAGIVAMLFSGLAIGATVATGPAFSASRWPQEVGDSGATVLFLVGAQIRMLMARPPADDDHENLVRLCCYGLSIPQDLEEQFATRFATQMRATSGSTECIGSAYIESVNGEHRWPSLGRPAADRLVAIMDDEGNATPTGQAGELCVRGTRGGSLMLGYWRRPDATEDAFRGGWYHTGDIGRMDEDGFLYFVDRKKDMIKRSGENVSAAEVEQVLCQMSDIVEAAVIGMPDPIREEAVVAFVTTDGDSMKVDDALEFCRSRLAPYKVPSEIRVVAELPHTSLGKIEKKMLREAIAEE